METVLKRLDGSSHVKSSEGNTDHAICRSLIVTLNVQHISLNLFPFRFFVSQRIPLVKSEDQSSRSCTTCLGLSQDGCLWPSLRWCCAGAGEASTFEEEHWPRWGDWKCGQVEVLDGWFSDFSTQKNRLTSEKAEASEMIYDPQRSQGANKYVKYDSWFLSKFFPELSWPGVGAYVGRSSGWVHGLCRFEEDRSLFGRHRCGSSRTGWHSCGRLEGHWSCVGATEAGQVLFLTSNWHSPDPTETWL